MFRRAGRFFPLQSTSPKVLPSAQKHFGRERVVLLPVASMKYIAAEQQPQQLTSELYKKLAQRFVYEELKIKFDFKIAQPPVTAQRVTFLFHLCLFPLWDLLFAQQLSQNGLQTWQKFPMREAGRNLCLRSWRNMLMKGCSALLTALDFFSKTDTAAETVPIYSNLVHQILQYLMKILGRWLQVHDAVKEKRTPSHFTVSNSPFSSPCSPPLPLEHTPEENIRFQALQTSSLNQHPVKLQVKGRNTSLPNHKGCNECGFNWLVQELHSQNQQLAMKSALLHCRLLNFCPCLQCGVSQK